jgi:hypothetical protein
LTASARTRRGTKRSGIGRQAAANAGQYATLDGFANLFYGRGHGHK